MHVKECNPVAVADYPALSAAIKNGDVLHGFLSGGGLRVVHLKDMANILTFTTPWSMLRKIVSLAAEYTMKFTARFTIII